MEIWDFVSSFLQAFLEPFLSLIAGLVAAWLLPKVIKIWQDLKAGNPEEVYLIEQIVGLAVQAAEQAAIGDLIEDRKDYACKVAGAWLAKYGIKLDVAVLAAAIEAAVKKELNPEKRFVDGK